jgi:uncharacterized hydantoinase/oxoprolinase family protein
MHVRKRCTFDPSVRASLNFHQDIGVRTELKLKPETIKCYSPQFERATENNLCLLRLIRLACCDANMLRAAGRKVVELASCATEAEL